MPIITYIHCMLVLVFSLFVCSEVVHVKWEVDMGDLFPDLRQGKERTEEEDTSIESIIGKERDTTTQKVLVGLNKRSDIGAVAQINTEIDMAFLLPEMYEKHRPLREKRSSASDNTDSVLDTNRRSFTNYKQYHDHVKRLKEVQALKKHNMVFKKKPSENNPLMYINNPVETGIEKSYLTLEEFKKVLTIRSQRDRQEFAKKHEQLAEKLNFKKQTVKVRKLQSDHGTTPADKKKRVTNKERISQSIKTSSRSLKNATKQDNTHATKTGVPKSTTKETKQTELLNSTYRVTEIVNSTAEAFYAEEPTDIREMPDYELNMDTKSMETNPLDIEAPLQLEEKELETEPTPPSDYEYSSHKNDKATRSLTDYDAEDVVSITVSNGFATERVVEIGGTMKYETKYNIKAFTPEYLQPNDGPNEKEYPDDTLTKRTKLSKPLVFMGGSSNNNNYNNY